MEKNSFGNLRDMVVVLLVIVGMCVAFPISGYAAEDRLVVERSVSDFRLCGRRPSGS